MSENSFGNLMLTLFLVSLITAFGVGYYKNKQIELVKVQRLEQCVSDPKETYKQEIIWVQDCQLYLQTIQSYNFNKTIEIKDKNTTKNTTKKGL